MNHKDHFHKDNTFIDNYEIGQLLGRGGFASVYRAKDCRTGLNVAIKITEKIITQKDASKRPIDRKRLENEIKIHSELEHSSIIKFLDAFEDDKNVYIVLELCQYGNLFRYLKRLGPLSEIDAAFIIKQLLQAVDYMHSNGVVHRDFKLSNILIYSVPTPVSPNRSYQSLNSNINNDGIVIKICDFGLAIQMDNPDEEHYTLCGTPNYIAPEIASMKSHSFPADLWSMGCLFYAMVVGRAPFDSTDVKETLQKIITGEYPEPKGISNLALDFMKSLLNLNPFKRANAVEILSHPFLNKDSKINDNMNNRNETDIENESTYSIDKKYLNSDISKMPLNLKEMESSDMIDKKYLNNSSNNELEYKYKFSLPSPQSRNSNYLPSSPSICSNYSETSQLTSQTSFLSNSISSHRDFSKSSESLIHYKDNNSFDSKHLIESNHSLLSNSNEQIQCRSSLSPDLSLSNRNKLNHSTDSYSSINKNNAKKDIYRDNNNNNNNLIKPRLSIDPSQSKKKSKSSSSNQLISHLSKLSCSSSWVDTIREYRQSIDKSLTLSKSLSSSSSNNIFQNDERIKNKIEQSNIEKTIPLKQLVSNKIPLQPFTYCSNTGDILIGSIDGDILLFTTIRDRNNILVTCRICVRVARPFVVNIGKLNEFMEAEMNKLRRQVYEENFGNNYNNKHENAFSTKLLCSNKHEILSNDLWLNSFNLNKLPAGIEKLYNRMEKILNIIMKNIPKLILYLSSKLIETSNISCKCMLMSNLPLPDFRVQFADGTKLQYYLQSGKLHIESNLYNSDNNKVPIIWDGLMSDNDIIDKKFNNNNNNNQLNESEEHTTGFSKEYDIIDDNNSFNANAPNSVKDYIKIAQVALKKCLQEEKIASSARSSINSPLTGENMKLPRIIVDNYDNISSIK